MTDQTERTIDPEAALENTVTLAEVRALFRDATADDPSLTPLDGFKLDFSGNHGFHKVFFSVSCHCGTAALLSVEVATAKTRDQIQQNLDELTGNLKDKALRFRNMSCDMHARMRLGRAHGRDLA